MYYIKPTKVRQLSGQQVKDQANYTISRDKSDKSSKIINDLVKRRRVKNSVGVLNEQDIELDGDIGNSQPIDFNTDIMDSEDNNEC